MQAIISGLNLLIKTLGVILGCLVALGILILIVLSWSNSNKEKASYECFLRRMDHHIEDASTETYHDTCMAAAGYQSTGDCTSTPLFVKPPFCFRPNWMAWK